ncbi:MAG: hypothetical protein ACC655_09030, partial [Rhodothermia bacterium]
LPESFTALPDSASPFGELMRSDQEPAGQTFLRDRGRCSAPSPPPFPEVDEDCIAATREDRIRAVHVSDF